MEIADGDELEVMRGLVTSCVCDEDGILEIYFWRDSTVHHKLTEEFLVKDWVYWSY